MTELIDLEPDPEEQLGEILGEPTTDAMLTAGAHWLDLTLARGGREPSDGVPTRALAAGVLYASLRGLDGSELLAAGVALGDLDGDQLVGIADAYALFLGAEYAKRLDRARSAGRVEALVAGLYPDGSWMIWSLRHGAWWKPGELGYTTDLASAGRFPPDFARSKCRWDYDNEQPGSVMVPGPSLNALAAPEVGELMMLRVTVAIDTARRAGPPQFEQPDEATATERRPAQSGNCEG